VSASILEKLIQGPKEIRDPDHYTYPIIMRDKHFDKLEVLEKKKKKKKKHNLP
jgi:hypothetical protein